MLGALEAGMPKEDMANSIDAVQLSQLLRETVKEGDTVLFKASRKMKLEEIIALCGLSE